MGTDPSIKLSDLNSAQLDVFINAIEAQEGNFTGTEIWVKAANIALSDSSKPLGNHNIIVKQNGITRTLQSDHAGLLPSIPLFGELIEVFVQETQLRLKKIGTLDSSLSKAYLFVRDMFVAEAHAAKHFLKNKAKISESSPFLYHVQPRDTLSQIAKKFHTTVRRIKSDNELRDDVIIAGQALRVSRNAKKDVPTSQHESKSAAKNHKSKSPAAPDKTTLPTSGVSEAPVGAETKQKAKKISPAISESPRHDADRSTTASVVVERSQDGEGAPLALITDTQRQNPWIAIAIAEAERWKGADESEITKTMNYHGLIDDKNWFKSLAGSKNAWCAAFVNWVMSQDNRAVVADRGDRHRARGFTSDSNFVRIDGPIFGAIGVLKDKSHVFFIYGVDEHSAQNLVVLGGNQGGHGDFGGTIDFSTFKKDNILFYVPLSYLPLAKQQLQKGVQLEKTSAAKLNKEHQIKDPKGNGTR
ncbi:LysM peptidoglycan-binding domain-containing protein [Caballeronia sp. S22]|uniref:LysM peptidoglycan-binding domain-containing protein n=1 Tax=Caballeronia sp. S22 TaxID=3137182 RepID=UPI003530EAF0